MRAFMFLTNPTVLLLAVLILLFSWQIPSRVQIELLGEYSKDMEEYTDAAKLLDMVQNQELVVVEGSLLYPDFPDVKAVVFSSPKILEFEGEDMQSTILEAELTNGWRLRVEGVATRLQLLGPESLTDLRLTQFERVKASPRLFWGGIALWLIMMILGWVQVYQVLKS
jgi:hypothetical protein